MNEAAASNFPAALRACMEAGCGKKANVGCIAAPWTQRMLAEEIEVSDRAVRQWLTGERTPDSKNFEQLLFILSPKDCPHQRAAYDQLKANRPPPMVTRQPRRPSATAEPQSLPAIPPDARPYRGLEAFREEDAHLFFGRDALARNVLDKLDHHRLVLLIGASGSGKSSLINAGILPKLRQDPTRTIVRCTPGDRAIANLAAALARAIEPDRSPADLLPAQHTYRQQLETDPEAIRDIAQLLPEGRLFLVIDQFEESFTLTRPTNPRQHEALIATLLAIARSPDERKLNALLGMRSDFMNELETADPRLVKTLDNAMVQMRAMLPDELEAAITGPLRPYVVTLEAGLLATIAGDLKGNPDALPLLEVALDELWQRRDDTNRKLTSTAYKEIGRITGGLAQRAESALEHLGLDEARIRHLFLQLVRVDPEGSGTKTTRRRRTRPDIGDDLWQLGQQATTHNLRLLVTSRDETTGSETLDIIHESLFRQWPRLASWIEEQHEFLLFSQRLDQRLTEFRESGNNPDFFFSRTELDRARSFTADIVNFFSLEQRLFLKASATHWSENVAENEARAIWGRLELVFEDSNCMPEHDWSIILELWRTNFETCRHFLHIATLDADVARKFNRRPELVLRAALRFDPISAIDRGSLALASVISDQNLDTTLAWIYIACEIEPLVPQNSKKIIARSLHLIEHTKNLKVIRVIAKIIADIECDFDAATLSRIAEVALKFIKETDDNENLQVAKSLISILPVEIGRAAAGLLTERLLLVVKCATHPNQLLTISETVVLLADNNDPELQRNCAFKIVNRSLYISEGLIEFSGMMDLARAIEVSARYLDAAAAAQSVARAFDLLAYAQLSYRENLVPAIAALVAQLDGETAKGIAHMVLRLARVAYLPSQVSALAQIISALAARLDETTINQVIAGLHSVAEETLDSDRLRFAALAIAGLSTRASAPSCDRIETPIRERLLEFAEFDKYPYSFAKLMETIGALNQLVASNDFDKRMEGAFARSIYFAEQAVDPLDFATCVNAITSLATVLEATAMRKVATQILARAFNIGQVRADSSTNFVLSEAIVPLVRSLDESAARWAADRTIVLAERATQPNRFRLFSTVIATLPDDCEPTIARVAAEKVVLRALEVASIPCDLYESGSLSYAVATLAPRLNGSLSTFACIEIVKRYLGVGSRAVTAIAYAAGRPDLLRPCPRRTFWAVMQHLAELKAANPDWDWLDLARPPLRTDELITTFRRLCADPPHWPAARHP